MSDFAEAERLGHENKRAVEQFRDFCLNGKIDVAVSPYGQALGLPIGRAEMRCQHAPFFGLSMMNVTDLAIEFYEQNCVECRYRHTLGRVPNIANVAAERRNAIANADAQLRDEAEIRRQAWAARKAARDAALILAPHRVRNLGEKIDILDADPSDPPDAMRLEEARLKVVETARAAPQLFAPALVDAVVTLAEALDPTAHKILLPLACANLIPAGRATKIAANTLAFIAMPAAGDIVAAFAAAMTPEDRSIAFVGAICLTAEPDRINDEWAPQPAAVLALADADWPLAVRQVVEALRSDDDERREVGAYAARHLIGADTSRLSALGEAIIRSIRGKDAGYVGRPHPTSAALKALSEAWKLDPDATVELVERLGTSIDDESRAQLADVPRRILLTQKDVLDQAAIAAIDFLVCRLDASWGSDIAADAAREIASVAETYPSALRPHAEHLFGAIIRASGVDLADGTQVSLIPAHLRRLETLDRRMTGRSYRRDLAEALGKLGRSGEENTLGRVFALLSATTNDKDADRQMRVALLRVLEKATTIDNVSKMLPKLYTWLLSTDPAVRGAAIRLWASCAAVVAALPENLDALAPPLLADPFVVVHGTIVKFVSHLKLSEQVRRDAIEMLISIALAHAKSDDVNLEIVKDSLSAVLWSADVRDPREKFDIARFVIETSAVLRSHGREEVLRWSSLRQFRQLSFWAVAALDELAAGHHERLLGQDERLLVDLVEEPRGLCDVPFEHFVALATPGLPKYIRRVSETVALLQAAGRWDDASRIALLSLREIPITTEFESRRQQLVLISDAAAAEAAVAADAIPAIWKHSTGEASFLRQARALSIVRQILRAVPSQDPARSADLIVHGAEEVKASNTQEPRITAFIGTLGVAAQLLINEGQNKVRR